MESFKDFRIGVKTYRVGRFTALVGSTVLTKILPAIIPHLDGNGNLSVTAAIQVLPEISTKDFTEIQFHCLKVASEINETGAPIPVMMIDGRWGLKHLEFDSVTVMALTAHALFFNLEPFFTGGGMQTIMQSLAPSSQSSS